MSSTVKSDLKTDQLGPLCRKRGISLVVLFGSRAKGLAKAGSDTDIGVWLDRYPIPPDEELALIRELVHATHNADLDVVILNQTNPVLGYSVAVYGQPLYEAEPHTFERYQRRSWKRYANTSKFRKLQKKYIESFLSKETRHA